MTMNFSTTILLVLVSATIGCAGSQLSRFLTIDEMKTLQPERVQIRCIDGRLFDVEQYAIEPSGLIVRGIEVKPLGRLPFIGKVSFDAILSIEDMTPSATAPLPGWLAFLVSLGLIVLAFILVGMISTAIEER